MRWSLQTRQSTVALKPSFALPQHSTPEWSLRLCAPGSYKTVDASVLMQTSMFELLHVDTEALVKQSATSSNVRVHRLQHALLWQFTCNALTVQRLCCSSWHSVDPNELPARCARYAAHAMLQGMGQAMTQHRMVALSSTPPQGSQQSEIVPC